MIDQRIGETIGLDCLACLCERQVLLRQDALRAEYHFHVVEPLGEQQEELDAARKGDGLECGEAGEQILPGRLLTTGQLGMKDRQRLSNPLQHHLGKEVIRDDPSSFIKWPYRREPGTITFLLVLDPSGSNRLGDPGRFSLEIPFRVSPRPTAMATVAGRCSKSSRNGISVEAHRADENDRSSRDGESSQNRGERGIP